MRFLHNILAKAGLIVDGVTQLNTIANATIDTDKFLVSDGGVIKYRTGAQLGSDIGAANIAASTLKHQVKLGEAINKGQAVYVSSADGTNMIVSKASNASEATSSKTLGLIETSGVLNDQVNVITEGLLAGLDTSTAAAGDPVWLGTNGNIIFGLPNKPYAPAHLVFIGIVTRVQQNNGEIFVKVQNGFELKEIHDVQITTTPSDNTVLAYESATSLYKMKSIATLLGYTPANAARQLTINGTTYDLTADRTWSVGTVTSIATTGPITGGTITGSGTIGITQATTSSNGYLSSTDWNTFNNKQNALTLTTTGSSGASTLVGATLNIPTYSLSGLGGVPSSRQLTINGTAYDLSADRSWSVGTVTSVGVSAPTGLSVSNTPVTGSGTIAISFTAGYSIPTTASQTNWDTAYNNRITSLTTTGTSGAATLTSNTLNIPQYQAQGNYITSLTGEATASGPGAASVTLTNSAVIGKVLTGLNVTGGSISATDSILTAFGKLQNQVNGLAGGVTYQGTWNASTNSPSLTSSVGTKGYYYVVSVAGSTNLNGITDWKLGDWAIFNGTSWEKVDNTDAVVSVNGFTGAVSLTTSNISEGTNLYYTDTRARAAISLTTTGSSGAATYVGGVINVPQYTLAGLGGEPAIAAGTTSQYWRGDKSWQTLNTTAVAEGTNLYYTDARARAALSFTAGSGAYNSSTGVITIPTNTNQLTNGAGFITGNQTITLSGDVTGSGATSISTTLANSGVTAGTYGGNNSIPSLVIDSKGRVTSASTVTPSGTWGISISGNAATATNANTVGGISASQIVYGSATTRQGTWQISDWNQTTYPDVAFLSSENGTANAPTSDYSYGLQYSFHRSGASYRTQMVTSLYSDLNIWVRNSRDSDVWTAWKVLLHSGNYNSYAPTLTGGGASGTWGINVTGTAASETLATVTGRGNTTSNSVRFGSHVDLSPTGSAFRFYDGSTFRGGFGLDSWAHGLSDSNLTLYVNGDNSLFFSTSGVKRGKLSSSEVYFSTYYPDTNYKVQFTGGDQINVQYGSGATTMYLNYHGGNGGAINMAAGRFTLDTSGNGIASGSLRAPIFYDSNDTSYYLDPNSGSNLYYSNFGNNSGNDQGIGIRYGNYSSGYGSIRFYQSGSNHSTIHSFSNSWQSGTLQGHSTGAINITGNLGVTFGAWNNVDMWIDTSGNAQARSSLRAPIFYDSDNTAYYGNFAGTSNFNIVLAKGYTDPNYTRIYAPGGGFSVNNSPQSGSIKIKLPTAASYTNTMLSFTVQIYNYSTYTSRTIRVGGYTYYTTDWYNIFAYQIGDQGADDLNVRFGKDGTGACIWIGETSTSWSYPNIFVTDVQSGHNQPTSMVDGWSVSIVTSFDTVQSTLTAYKNINTGNYNSYSPTLTGGGASGTWGISITGDADTVDGYHLNQDVRTTANPTFNSVYVGDTTARITQGNGSAARFNTPSGWVEIGAMNTSWGHFQTDRPNFYFNKSIYIDGQAWIYGGSRLVEANGGTWGISISGNSATTSQTNFSSLTVNSATVATQSWVTSQGYITSTNTDFTYNASLTLSTSWQDTGVSNSNLTTSGVYMVTCYANDFGSGGSQYQVTYVGTMYWFAGSTNNVNYSEIALHHMGHADNDRYIYLRTRQTYSAGGTFLQIRGNGNNSGASTYTFYFKRLM